MHRAHRPLRCTVLAVVIALMAGLAVGTIRADRAAACSCLELDDPAASELADVVFQGRLVASDMTDVDSPATGGVVALDFAVRTVFKGAAAERHTLLTAGDSASCGFAPPPGGEYLVFATSGGAFLEGAGSSLVTGMCTRTRLLTDAAAVPATFGAGTAPQPGEIHADMSGFDLSEVAEPGVGEPADGDGPPIGWIALVAAVAIVAFGGMVVVRRRR